MNCRLWIVVVDTHVRIERLIVDSDESDAVATDQTITLSSWSVVALA